MIVRDLPEELQGAAVALWHDVGLTRPWNDPVDDLRRALAGPSSRLLAVTEGDRLLGTAMTGHDGHRGWVYYLAVDPTERHRGVGRALVTAAEVWLAEHVPKVQLMIRSDNDAATAFYERLGYVASDVQVLGRRLRE